MKHLAPNMNGRMFGGYILEFRSLIAPTLVGFIQRPPNTRKVGEVDIATSVHTKECMCTFKYSKATELGMDTG